MVAALPIAGAAPRTSGVALNPVVVDFPLAGEVVDLDAGAREEELAKASAEFDGGYLVVRPGGKVDPTIAIALRVSPANRARSAGVIFVAGGSGREGRSQRHLKGRTADRENLYGDGLRAMRGLRQDDRVDTIHDQVGEV